ncbi:hydrolase [Ruegeria sp. ANG-R]|uniref:cysteine hydrolase family protein n=1 Tax=Ruegeria sp. ANG-R TaxID=1577903 RepID=UPI00057F4151|nr:cysteine hydrolase family protein [Ruegeria sp. ANG-R]KIC43348.1 hydrolase [Ruegeria sp. ANG-R]
MKQAVLIVDVQPCFDPPTWLVERASLLSAAFPSVATVERHDEDIVPFQRQLGWHPAKDDQSLVEANHVVIKHGYGPTTEAIDLLKSFNPARVLVCGIQAETCVLAAGFALFDSGLHPTIVADAVVGSSLDRSGQLGIKLWEHHFGQVVRSYRELLD